MRAHRYRDRKGLGTVAGGCLGADVYHRHAPRCAGRTKVEVKVRSVARASNTLDTKDQGRVFE